MMRSVTLSPLKAASPRPIASRHGLVVQANTLWSLAPRESKSQFFEGSRTLVDLTGIIGSRKLCSVGAKDYATKSSEVIDLTLVDHGGLHLLFEAEGASNPVDSPSVLFVTDLDSECEVAVDGKALKKGVKTKLHPGATIEMGDEASYVVLRNVHAHA